MITNVHRLIILDVMMGGISGFKMAERLRKAENFVPIIFLTAKNTENDMLTGFSLGGDDYIAKPFSVKEVLVRVKALLKRTSHPAGSVEANWSYKGLNIDLPGNRVTIDGNEISLTKKEFEILLLLARTSPNLLARSEILNSVWGENEFVLDRTVDVHITRLRKKLGDYAGIIVNRSGFGYYLNTDMNYKS
jgi:DNA-binding response OmpR family regulator